MIVGNVVGDKGITDDCQLSPQSIIYVATFLWNELNFVLSIACYHGYLFEGLEVTMNKITS